MFCFVFWIFYTIPEVICTNEIKDIWWTIFCLALSCCCKDVWGEEKSSRVSKWHKRNAVIWDLHRSKRVSSNFETGIKHKFRYVDYPTKFLNSVINQLLTSKINNSFIIPTDLLEESKPFILVEIPCCEENGNAFKTFY